MTRAMTLLPRFEAETRLILKSDLSPGDAVMLTAAVRDLHLAHPGRFMTDVRTSSPEVWLHNPWITRLDECAEGVKVLELNYPLINESNARPCHFLQGYPQDLSRQLRLSVPISQFRGDIYLSAAEKREPSPAEEHGCRGGHWIVVAGGKYDFTAKWWNPTSFQAVVDHFRGRIQFVQCGDAEHWHPRLDGAIDLVGKTDLRQLIRLVYHAEGVLCPVTLAMHLAAAVPTRRGRPAMRPCVVVAGGREPQHWEAYPGHQFISTCGMLSCCARGGCWKSRCQAVGDGDEKDEYQRCEQPVQVSPDLLIPRCMQMIRPEDVIRRIEMYIEGRVGP